MNPRPKLSEYARRMVARWVRQRRNFRELADLAEAAGESGAQYRKIADELTAWIEHVRQGSLAPLPPAPWLEMYLDDIKMEYSFKLAEFRLAQEGSHA